MPALPIASRARPRAGKHRAWKPRAWKHRRPAHPRRAARRQGGMAAAARRRGARRLRRTRQGHRDRDPRRRQGRKASTARRPGAQRRAAQQTARRTPKAPDHTTITNPARHKGTAPRRRRPSTRHGCKSIHLWVLASELTVRPGLRRPPRDGAVMTPSLPMIVRMCRGVRPGGAVQRGDGTGGPYRPFPLRLRVGVRPFCGEGDGGALRAAGRGLGLGGRDQHDVLAGQGGTRGQINDQLVADHAAGVFSSTAIAFPVRPCGSWTFPTDFTAGSAASMRNPAARTSGFTGMSITRPRATW